ncbi:uncharacterized protein SPPG_09503 [Spizellomyces punctatus DAOM BR117]|uniref:G-protein coupled receptors family 1 profile domain-containing protein n=1 Tax=Spizellomyces punctatus (strain DAOM BR117) TaxID=645134 RepID=A0A0L0H638_SPIPD|nr:uncharacterized protein SPPG_09503 [Spizellomyces punctatus DAOM BR117]KNC96975.1 hypothetical protein SPPG_09503 [Spizellomyces punctatus DAOM BR117]|eukprot:XP_016605015.1 hypothetical protein SPPG_09503 [Spizellomyces punctatus DAOM BR117]
MADATDWIGIPYERTLTSLQKTHDSIGVILHSGALLIAIFNFTLFITSSDLRTGATKWHNWIIFYIGIGDLFLNVFQLGAVLDMLRSGKWRLSDSWCQFQGFMSCVGGFISILGIGLLTQERSHTILMGKKWTGLLTGCGITLCTVTSIILASIYFASGNKYAVQEAGIYCCPDWGSVLRPQPHPVVNRRLTVILGMVAVLSMLNVGVTYTAIWLIVRKAARKLGGIQTNDKKKRDGNSTSASVPQNQSASAHQNSNMVANTSRDDISRPSESQIGGQSRLAETKIALSKNDLSIQRIGKLESQVARKCAIMVICFTMMWLPNTVKMIYSGINHEPVSNKFDMYASILAVSPGIFNPLVNFFIDPRWNKASKDLLAKIGRRIQGGYRSVAKSCRRSITGIRSLLGNVAKSPEDG